MQNGNILALWGWIWLQTTQVTLWSNSLNNCWGWTGQAQFDYVTGLQLGRDAIVFRWSSREFAQGIGTSVYIRWAYIVYCVLNLYKLKTFFWDLDLIRKSWLDIRKFWLHILLFEYYILDHILADIHIGSAYQSGGSLDCFWRGPLHVFCYFSSITCLFNAISAKLLTL